MQERDEVVFKEPILEQKDVMARIDFAEPAEWKPKEAVRQLPGGEKLEESYKAAKLQFIIEDDTVKTEHADAQPKLNVDLQFNVVKYPFAKTDKKTGEKAIAWMNRQFLFDCETAFGFDPCFVDRDNQPVEAHVTRTGNKIAPKVDGVARVLNPAFVASYFHQDMTINPTNWIGKKVLVDIGIEESEQFGNKNIVTRIKKVNAV